MGKLVQVDTFTVSSAVASVTLGGGSSGSSGLNASINTDDVYMVVWNNVQISGAVDSLYIRVTKSGTPDTTANYDRAGKQLRADTTFGNLAGTNETWYITGIGSDVATNRLSNGIMYLYNFNSNSEYSFGTIETSHRDEAGNHRGLQGGFVHTVQSSSDGLWFNFNSGNIASGSQFTLYKVL